MQGITDNNHHQSHGPQTPGSHIPVLKSKLTFNSLVDISSPKFKEASNFQKYFGDMEHHIVDDNRTSLIEDTFPDSCVPFDLDFLLESKIRSFGHDDGSDNQRYITLCQYLASPPLKKNGESVLAEWLNNIVEFIEGKVPNVREYTTMESLADTLPQRRWSAEGCQGALPAVTRFKLRRKPDIVLLDMVDNKTESLSWANIRVVCETTATTMHKSKTITGTLQDKAYIMLSVQDDRLFCPTVSFTKDQFGFAVFDCEGRSTFSSSYSTPGSPKRLLRLLGCLVFGRPALIGYDETIKCIKGKAAEIKLLGETWHVERKLNNTISSIGRRTKCWAVSREFDGVRKVFALKDAWPDSSNHDNEFKILTRIRDEKINHGRSLPQLHSWGKVPVPTQNCCIGGTKFINDEDCTTRRRVSSSASSGRIHIRLVSSPVAYPISSFINLKDFVGLFIDAIKAHQSLWKSKILHRDVSNANVMVVTIQPEDRNDAHDDLLRADGRYHFGFLNDMDWAIDFSGDNNSSSEQSHTELLYKTGTPLFMSMVLSLQSTDAKQPLFHGVRHDLESFFHVIIYFITLYEGPRQKRLPGTTTVPEQYKPNERPVSLDAMTGLKSLIFRDLPYFRAKIAQSSEYFLPIRQLIEELCALIFETSDDGNIHCFRPIGTHETALDRLLRSFKELQDVKQEDIPADPYAHVIDEMSLSPEASLSKPRSHMGSAHASTSRSVNRESHSASARTHSGTHSMSLRQRKNTAKLIDSSQSSAPHPPSTSSTMASSLSQSSTLASSHDGKASSSSHSLKRKRNDDEIDRP